MAGARITSLISMMLILRHALTTKIGKNRAASRENMPLGRSASSYARTVAVRYTCVSFLASEPATREGLRASPAHGGTRGVCR